MFKKGLLILLTVIIAAAFFMGCEPDEVEEEPEEEPEEVAEPELNYQSVENSSFEDGTYRGIFEDGGEMQVNVQFVLVDNVVEDMSFRHLAYGGQEYDVDDEGMQGDVARQYEQLAEQLEGNDIRDTISDLYDADGLVEDYDTVTGATLRASKMASAIVDGVNRGVYRFSDEPLDGEIPEGYSPIAGESFEDGTYRGIFSDGDEMQVNVQFVLQDNIVEDIGFRHLAYGGEEYDVDDEGMQGDVANQYEQLAEHLEGTDIRETVADLYDADGLVEDYDTVTGATLRASKMSSAIVDGVNRGVYRFTDEPLDGEVPEGYQPAGPTFEDGTYRGVFADGGEMQVNVQFVLVDNVVEDISYRHLAYGGEEYDVEDDGMHGEVAQQYEQAIEHLEGRDIRETLADLYEPGKVVDDFDTVTGATLRATKLTSAVVDGLNRGVYRFTDEPLDGEVPEGYSPLNFSFEDGTYRGIFEDGGEMQVNVQFILEDNEVVDIGYRHLAYGGEEYDVDDEGMHGDVATQYEQLADYLLGTDIRASLGDTYNADGIVDDFDGATGATLRASKLTSAIKDGLNRGVYRVREVGDEVPPAYSPVVGQSFEDGTYRGIFSDGGEMQVNVQFVLQDNVVEDMGLRHLVYGGEEYDVEDEGMIGDIATQYEQLADYLEGSDIRARLGDLYDADGIVDDFDGATGATLRANKMTSAVKDGLNRGVYRFTDEPLDGVVPGGYSTVGISFEDGTYRGVFADGGDMQVNVQFTLEDNIITDMSYRHLYYDDMDYLEDENPVTEQYYQVIDHLEGTDIRMTLTDLYEPGDVVEDVDGITGATLRGSKVTSSVTDGINRGVYRID